MAENDKRLNLEQTFLRAGTAAADDVVGRFTDHVARTGNPTSFPGLSITRPPLGAEFVWMTGEIIVPVHKSEKGEWVVCPWCSPSTPKFKRGRLCWFPAEQVYRFVGWRCAKTHLDSDSMREADKRWDAEKKRMLCNAFLRENCIRVEQLLQFSKKMAAAAISCDRFYAAFSKDSSEVHADLARYVRDGRLYIDQSLGAGARRAGQGSISVLFGVLDGTRVLKGKPALDKKLANARAQLASISDAAHRARFGELSHLDERERHGLQVVIQEAHKELIRIAYTIEEFQIFMSSKNISLLSEWCQHEHSDVYSSGIDVVLDGKRLRFGYRVKGNRCTMSVLAEDAMFERPPFIEALRRGDAAQK